MSNTGYSKEQVVLHWTIAAIIIVQMVLHEGIVVASELLRNGNALSSSELLPARIHVVLGICIFMLGLYRVWVRIREGAPPPPEEERALFKTLSKLTHLVLYAAILLMPVSGALAWFAGSSVAASLHGLAKFLLIAFVFLHVAGAVYQHFILKSTVMRRMIRPE